MLKELLIKDTKEKLRLLIQGTKEKYLSKLDEEDQVEVSTIIDKENYTLDDINTLLIDYFSYELSNEELFGLIKNNSSFKKKISKTELLLYIIESYLINIKEYQSCIIFLINNEININDIDILDKYLTNKDFTDNKQIIPIIQNLEKTSNEIIKNITTKLSIIFNIFDNKLLNLDLIKSFYPGELTEYNNYYFVYQEVTNKLFNLITQKEITLLCFTFINDIDIFKEVKLTKNDLILFLKKIENNNHTLNNNQINNLLNNFKKKYYQDNDLNNKIEPLKRKVFETYDDYFNNNFYFKIEDFINYYNTLYQDDFSLLCFQEEYQPLNRNIFDSLFSVKNVNETTILLESELNDFKIFQPSIIEYKLSCLEADKIYYERFKFYLQYVEKVQEYLQYKNDITIEYYILKNIPSNDKTAFYELFRAYYGKEYREIGRNGRSIQKSYLSLKKEYIEELNNSPFEIRYEILNKYKEYCITLRSLSLFNEEHLLEIMKEYENKYYNASVPKKKSKKRHQK